MTEKLSVCSYKHLGRPRCRWEDNIEMGLVEIRWAWLDLLGSGLGQVKSSCECSNEPLGYIKCWKIIKWQHNWWILIVLSSIELSQSIGSLVGRLVLLYQTTQNHTSTCQSAIILKITFWLNFIWKVLRQNPWNCIANYTKPTELCYSLFYQIALPS